MKRSVLIAMTFALPLCGCGGQNSDSSSEINRTAAYNLNGMPAEKYYEQFLLRVSGTCPNNITYNQAMSDRITVGADVRGSALTAQIRLFLMPDHIYYASYTELARDSSQPGGFDWANGTSIELRGKWAVEADKLVLEGFGHASGLISNDEPAFALKVASSGLPARAQDRTFLFKMNGNGYLPFEELSACLLKN
jgi:hypothetical protein